MHKHHEITAYSAYTFSAKHFINDPTHLVQSALQAITLTNPTTALDQENKIIYLRPDAAQPQVSVISGGGSGHEPSFAAFVGPGLLSAAVAGTIFASPSAEQIRRCILSRVDSSKGVLVVVMNYTGDVLNFGMAVEKAKATGLDIEMLVVADDVGVGRERGGKVGRRGIAGTVLVHKIAGALAARGAPLQQVYKAAKAVADNTVSIGSSLSHVHVPGREAVEDELKENEVEIGMGIHNETGSERRQTDLTGLVETMLEHLLDQNDKDRAFLNISSSDEVVLMINNLGGVSVLELGGITTEVVAQLRKYNLNLVRVISGTFMTSLNGLGFSITLLKVPDTGLDVPFLDLLDSPAEVAGWTAPIKSSTWKHKPSAERLNNATQSEDSRVSGMKLDLSQTKAALNAGLKAVIEAEPDVTKFDTAVGDGDCGTGLKRGAEAIQKYLTKSSQSDAAMFVDDVVNVVESSMDGTSGALYAIFLNALAHGIRKQSHGNSQQADTAVWSKALDTAMQSLNKYTPAQAGDRTLVDALSPFIEQLRSTQDVQIASAAALQGAEATRGMKASLGRTVYVGGTYSDVPDPGAYGLAQFFKGFAEGLT